MKAARILFVLLYLTTQSFGQSTRSGRVSLVANMKAFETTKQQAIIILGTPDDTIANDHITQWRYRSQTELLTFKWDTQSGKLIDCSFTNLEQHKKAAWDDAAYKGMYVKAPVDEVLRWLGRPNGMIVKRDGVHIQYVYQNGIAQLDFQNGKLLHYEMSFL